MILPGMTLISLLLVPSAGARPKQKAAVPKKDPLADYVQRVTGAAPLPGQDAMAGEDDYNYLGTQAFASAIAAGCGFGIAKLISEHLGSTKVAPEGSAPAPADKVSVTSADRIT